MASVAQDRSVEELRDLVYRLVTTAVVLLAVLPVLLSCPASRPEDSSRDAGDTLAGHYTWGHEVHTFQPCSIDQVYWVRASREMTERLKERYRELATAPYEPVFVRVSGESGEVPIEYRDGFAGDYDGLFTIEVIHEIRSRRDDDCRTTE